MPRKRATKKTGGLSLADLKNLGSQVLAAAVEKAKDVGTKAKEKQVLSRSLDDVGLDVPAEIARRLGYGKKKRATKKKMGGLVPLVKDVMIPRNKTAVDMSTIAAGRKRKMPKKAGLDLGFIGDILGNLAKPIAYGVGGVQQGLSMIGKGRRRRGGAASVDQLRPPQRVLLPNQMYSAYY